MKYLILIFALCLGLVFSYEEDLAYAVKLGYPVTTSTVYAPGYCNYHLDNTQRTGLAWSWSAGSNDVHQWIQVSSIVPQTWAAVITQGRGDYDQWLTTFMVLYSNDGINWSAVDEGKIFQGNSDRNSQVTNWFENPVTARTIRIKPTSWNSHISMRFDALFYLDKEYQE